MPSHQRSSANTGRRAQSSPKQSPAQDFEETLLDQLKDKNTELNKANEELDRYQRLLDQANRKLSAAHSAQDDLKLQVQSLKESNTLLKKQVEELEEENDHLDYQREVWDEHYMILEKRYQELTDHYNVVVASAPASASYRGATTLPERPKTPHRSSSRKEHRERKGEREGKREGKGQRDRLSRRFEEKRSGSSRQARHIEGWGPGAGGALPEPPSGRRTFTSVAVTGHGKSPATSPSHNKVSFSVPRTTYPLSPSLYSTGGSAVYDDYEDGNYHAYPVGR